MKNKNNFICSIEPNSNGQYKWLLEVDRKTYGGLSPSQKFAMDEAFKILNTPMKKEPIDMTFENVVKTMGMINKAIYGINPYEKKGENEELEVQGDIANEREQEDQNEA